jgi:hypothetical protein
MTSIDLLAALQREVHAATVANRHAPERIRLNPGMPVDVFAALPIPSRDEIDEIRARLDWRQPYEVLVHPTTWAQLETSKGVEHVESNMRADGKTEDEIVAMKINSYANPQDWRAFGIPVVDDTPLVAPKKEHAP